MPVMPLSPIPPPVDVAGAYGRGATIALQQQQLRQQEIESQRNAQLRAQEIAAQKQIANQRAAQAAQQAQYENALQQARFGLAERELGMQEKALNEELLNQGRQFQQQELISAEAQELAKRTGVPFERAWFQTALKYGGEVPAAAWSAMGATQEQDVNLGQTFPVEGGGQVVRTSRTGGVYRPDAETSGLSPSQRASLKMQEINGLRNSLNQMRSQHARLIEQWGDEPGSVAYDKRQEAIDKLETRITDEEAALKELSEAPEPRRVQQPQPETPAPAAPTEYESIPGQEGFSLRPKGQPASEFETIEGPEGFTLARKDTVAQPPAEFLSTDFGPATGTIGFPIRPKFGGPIVPVPGIGKRKPTIKSIKQIR